MRFNELTNENYLMYALLHYDNLHCIDIKEYFEDVRKLKYIKRLFNRYKEDGVMKERLILNHLISFYNVFENEAATRLLFFRVGTEYYSLLKTFLVMLIIAIISAVLKSFLPSLGTLIAWIVLIWIFHEIFRLKYYKAIIVWILWIFFVFILTFILSLFGLESLYLF